MDEKEKQLNPREVLENFDFELWAEKKGVIPSDEYYGGAEALLSFLKILFAKLYPKS